MKDHIFLIELNGTILKRDIFSEIALKTDLNITQKTNLQCELPYRKTFMEQMSLLKPFSILQIVDIISNIPQNEILLSFLHKQKSNCKIVSDFPDVFIDPLCKELGLEYFSSIASVKNGKLASISKVLDKQAIPDLFDVSVVSVGCNDNDAEMLSKSKLGIAYGGYLSVSSSVLKNATHAIYSEERLCHFLKQL